MDEELRKKLTTLNPKFGPRIKLPTAEELQIEVDRYFGKLGVGIPGVDGLLNDGLPLGAFTTLVGNVPKFMPGMALRDLAKSVGILLPADGQYFSSIDDAEASFDGIVAKGSFGKIKHLFEDDGKLNISIRENNNTPIHTFIQRWNANGAYMAKRPDEPVIKGSMKCGLNYEWVKWARDYYNVSLVTAIHIGKDFIECGGVEPD